ncbi:MAG: HpcH/HpaI aldolase/citrate lyase family protein [Janthinobacterium lividum]
MIVRPRRSALYVPGSNTRALAKSRTLDADALIFDLEDAVAPGDKADARDAVVRAVVEGGFGFRDCVVRINALDTPWGQDDLAAAAGVMPDAILLPKVSSPLQVLEAARILATIGAAEKVRLWAMVETPAAVLGIADIARTGADPTSRLDVLVMGTNDLAKDLRLRVGPGREPLQVWLATSVAAARCHGLDILDGVFNGLDDLAGLAAEARQGRDFGMDGKTCIHPGQIAACNDAFSPEPAELAWACRIVAAFDGPQGAELNVLRIDGQMVERLHVEAARRLLAMEELLAQRRSAGALTR